MTGAQVRLTLNPTGIVSLRTDFANGDAYAMAARENGQIPLRMFFSDLDAEKIIEHALLQWSEWLHIDERSSPAERERAELMKDQFERQEDRSTMFYPRKMLRGCGNGLNGSMVRACRQMHSCSAILSRIYEHK